MQVILEFCVSFVNQALDSPRRFPPVEVLRHRAERRQTLVIKLVDRLRNAPVYDERGVPRGERHRDEIVHPKVDPSVPSVWLSLRNFLDSVDNFKGDEPPVRDESNLLERLDLAGRVLVFSNKLGLNREPLEYFREQDLSVTNFSLLICES